MRRPGLFASFLVVSALLSGATGAALVYQVGRQAERRALDAAIDEARVIAEAIGRSIPVPAGVSA